MIKDEIPKVREGLEIVLGRKKAQEYGAQDTGIEFWLAWMNEEEVTRLRELAPSVSLRKPTTNGLTLRDLM